MKKIYTIAIGTVVLAIALAFFLGSLANSINSEIGKEKEKYENYVGKKHMLDKDTLTIIDYSILEETFTLSNGQKVSYKFVTNQK